MLLLLCPIMAANCGEQAVCADCYAEGFRVKVLADTDPAPAVLFSGFRNGACQHDVLCTGTPDAFLGDLDRGPLQWGCWAEDRELIVFAGGHSPTLGPVVPAGSEVSIVLGRMKPLRVTAWVLPSADGEESPTEEYMQWMGTQLENAARIFDELGTGILLEYALKRFPVDRLDELDGLADNASCDFQEQLVGSTASPQQDLTAVSDPGRLNLYYVGGIDGLYPGMTCIYNERLPYVLFVAPAYTHTPALTAHELGHALGLQSKAALPDGTISNDPGDVDDLELYRYFPGDNLMQSNVTDVRQVTIGQIYRMHFDQRSWLRRGDPVTDGYPRLCQDSPILGGPCPPLTLHPPRGWP
jgi:hypothetical protein